MNSQNEIFHGTFESVEQSGILDGMSDHNMEDAINRGVEILNTYGAKQEQSCRTEKNGHLYMGTTIPLNLDDKEELFDLGWYESPTKWPPDSESIEQYGFNTVKCNV